MVLARVRVPLTEFSGGPGVNVWHFTNPNNINPDVVGLALREFYANNSLRLVEDLVVQGTSEIEILDEDTGQIIAVEPVDVAIPNVSGQASGDISRATQLKLQLRTNTIRNGRLVQGGCWIGPVGREVLDSAGGVIGAARQGLVDAFNDNLALMSDGTVTAVYSRPKGDPPTGGLAATVTSASVWSTPGTLRGRKT